jgi:hypothetical protein
VVVLLTALPRALRIYVAAGVPCDSSATIPAGFTVRGIVAGMSEAVRHAERMRLPWWGWPAGTALAVGVAFIFNMGSTEWYRLAPLVAAPLVALPALWWLSRLPVRVVAAEDGPWLHVDDARLPLSAVAEVEALDRTSFADALGVASHPLGFVVQRPWIRQGVKVVLDDPEDPTPYWLVSSRNPGRLREAIVAAQAQSLQIG